MIYIICQMQFFGDGEMFLDWTIAFKVGMILLNIFLNCKGDRKIG